MRNDCDHIYSKEEFDAIISKRGWTVQKEKVYNRGNQLVARFKVIDGKYCMDMVPMHV